KNYTSEHRNPVEFVLHQWKKCASIILPAIRDSLLQLLTENEVHYQVYFEEKNYDDTKPMAKRDHRTRTHDAKPKEASKLSAFANKITVREKPPVQCGSVNGGKGTAWQSPPIFLNTTISCQVVKLLYDRLLVDRRLTEDELGTCRALLKCGTPSCEVWQFVAGKVLNTQDVYCYRRACRLALLNDMPSVLEKPRETGRVLVWQSVQGHYSHICFSRWQQIALFQRFPDVVNVNKTHATNLFGYKLRTCLLTGGMGIRRPVIYAFVESKQLAPMRKLFNLFKKMMGKHYPARTFLMDTSAAQVRAARVVFCCNVMLCYFHIEKAIRKHYVAFNIHVFLVIDTLCEQPTHSLPHGSPGQRHTSGMAHFSNVTNNRLEKANGRFNDRVHHADTLQHAVQKVSWHAEWLMREFEMHTSYLCDGQEILEGDGYILTGVCRMTAYACSLILRHLGPRSPMLPYDCWHKQDFCLASFSIHQRRLSDYNIPEKTVPLTLVLKPPPAAFDALRKQPNRVVYKLQEPELRKTTDSFRKLIVHGKILLRQRSHSATDGLPSVVQDTAPQPRWRSRDTDLGFCVLCDRPTTTSDRCFRPVQKRKGVLATRSAKRVSYDVDLDRSTESKHSVSRRSVFVRFFWSKEELFDSRRQWSNERFSRRSSCISWQDVCIHLDDQHNNFSCRLLWNFSPNCTSQPNHLKRDVRYGAVQKLKYVSAMMARHCHTQFDSTPATKPFLLLAIPSRQLGPLLTTTNKLMLHSECELIVTPPRIVNEHYYYYFTLPKYDVSMTVPRLPRPVRWTARSSPYPQYSPDEAVTCTCKTASILLVRART
ncbi:hypothetical protein CLF_112126, partial [Clonorchis sinensis]